MNKKQRIEDIKEFKGELEKIFYGVTGIYRSGYDRAISGLLKKYIKELFEMSHKGRTI